MQLLLVIIAAFAALSSAQVVDFSSAWRLHFPQCSLAREGNGVSFLQSPIALPTAGTLSTARLPFTRSEQSPGMIYLPVVRSTTTVTVRLVHASASIVLNGTSYRAVSVRYLRPPEHVPQGTTAAVAATMVEQQVTFRSDNVTAFVSSQIFAADAAAATASEDVSRTLIDAVVSAPNASAKMVPGAWDYGLRTELVMLYPGTGAAPDCDLVRWLIGTSPISVPPAAVEQFPVAVRRDAVAITAAQESALVSMVQLAGAAPAGDALQPLVTDAPSVSNMSFAFGPRSNGALSDRVVLQTALFMAAGLCGVMAIAITAVMVQRLTYRSEERSTWVHGRHGTQYFGFGPSTLYVQDLDESGSEGSDEETDEEDYEEGE